MPLVIPAGMPLIPLGKLLNMLVDGTTGMLDAKVDGKVAPEARIWWNS